MEINIAINISGIDFTPDKFNEGLPSNLKGDVNKYKKEASKRVEERYYWSVEKLVPLDVYPTVALHDFIVLYVPYLNEISTIKCKKYAEIIVNYESVDEISGFFIDKSLIAICEEHGLEIDIDVYTDIC